MQSKWVVVLVLAAAVLSGGVSASSQQCAIAANYNLTEADIAAPKFVVSVDDCCQYCAAIPNCIVAVFSNYYCYPKGVAGNPVAAAGCTLVSPPQTIIPTTASPTTSAPTTEVPSSAPTFAPPVGTVTVIREVTCQYSGHCNESNDNSCYTKVYYNNTCQGKGKRVCGTYTIDVDTYADDGCSGVVLKTKQEKLNVCESVDYSYYGHYCDVQPTPATGAQLYRSACNYGCNSQANECTSFNLTTGICMQSNPFSNLAGSSIIGWCFGEYVVFNAYGSIDCTGPIEDSRAEPRGCWQSAYTYIFNGCTL